MSKLIENLNSIPLILKIKGWKPISHKRMKEIEGKEIITYIFKKHLIKKGIFTPNYFFKIDGYKFKSTDNTFQNWSLHRIFPQDYLKKLKTKEEKSNYEYGSWLGLSKIIPYENSEGIILLKEKNHNYP